MVCCQRSGKNDPEQIAASFAQTTRREGGGGRGGRGGVGEGEQIFPTLRMTYGRARPPARRSDDRARSPRLVLPAAHRDQNIVACFMGSLIAVVCLAG